MKQRIGKRNYMLYAMDIESHNDIESIRKRETSMWLGCFIDENSTVYDESSYFYDMDEFLDRLDAMSSKKAQHSKTKPCNNICVYIYNLSFEWSFLLPYLLKRGFTYKEEIEDSDEFVYNSTSTRSCSSVWCAQIRFKKNNGRVILRDLAKIYGGGLRKVAKSFKLPTQKGDIDYRLDRLNWYDEYDLPHPFDEHSIPSRYIPTFEEKEYCFKDCRILIDILLEMQRRGDKDFFNVTSMASYSMKKLLKCAYPRATKPYKEYRKDYPELSFEENEFLRKGVEGGITYAPSRWQFKEIKEKIIHVDAHQMHPTQMYSKIFPYGEGTYFKGRPTKFGFYINACHIRISYAGVKLHSIIKLIGLDFVEDKEIVVWDFEIPTMMKCYNNLEIEYIDGYSYKARPLKFKKYPAENYRKRLIAKKEKDDFNILYYKLLNNSSYGKFLEKPHNLLFANIVDAEGIITSNVIEKEDIEANAKYTYLPVGSCIPAYSRVQLIELALEMGWENIVYFDTDSIFAIDTPHVEEVWNRTNQEDFLEGWGLEEYIDEAQFTAPKRYKLKVGDTTIVKMAGINFDREVPYDEINIVKDEYIIQRAFRCKGGTIVDVQRKQIDVQAKYKDIFERNKN